MPSCGKSLRALAILLKFNMPNHRSEKILYFVSHFVKNTALEKGDIAPDWLAPVFESQEAAKRWASEYPGSEVFFHKIIVIDDVFSNKVN